MAVIEQIREKVEELLQDPSYFIVEIDLKGGKGNPTLQILIDGDEGVRIDECARISRQLGAYIEETALIEEAYILEVSSPGLDHPLSNERQYKKNLGRKVRIQSLEGKQHEGELLEVAEKGIKILAEKKLKSQGKKKRIEKEEAFIPFKEINNCKVLVSFK